MSTEEILALLIAERDRMNRAIEALQGPTKRPGRPSQRAVSTAATTVPKRKRRRFSAEQREAAAERMRQRWAAKRKAEAKSKGKPKKTA
jgi:hypothetical protein